MDAGPAGHGSPKAGATDTAAPGSETPTLEQQQADALALLVESALHHDLDPGAPGERYQVVVHVDARAFPRKRPSARPATPARS